MTSFILAFLLGACTLPPVAPARLASAALPPSGFGVIGPPWMVTGHEAAIDVHDARIGRPVALVGSASLGPPMACPALLAPTCLPLAEPLIAALHLLALPVLAHAGEVHMLANPLLPTCEVLAELLDVVVDGVSEVDGGATCGP